MPVPPPRTGTAHPAVVRAARELADGPVADLILAAAERLHARGDLPGKPPVSVIAAALSDHLATALSGVTRRYVEQAQGEGRGRRIPARAEAAALIGLSRQSLEKRLGLVPVSPPRKRPADS